MNVRSSESVLSELRAIGRDCLAHKMQLAHRMYSVRPPFKHYYPFHAVTAGYAEAIREQGHITQDEFEAAMTYLDNPEPRLAIGQWWNQDQQRKAIAS